MGSCGLFARVAKFACPQRVAKPHFNAKSNLNRSKGGAVG